MGGAHGPDVAGFIGLLVAVAVVAAAVRFVRLPYTVALVVTGLVLALAPDTPRVQLTPGVILTVFLPVLLFHGAYNLDLADLRANLTPVSLLAIPGVVVTAGVVGAALHLVASLSWSSALLFGAIVSATDPVAVLAIFYDVGVPRRLEAVMHFYYHQSSNLALRDAISRKAGRNRASVGQDRCVSACQPTIHGRRERHSSL